MFIRKYWLPLSVFLLLIVGIGLYYLQTHPPKDPIVIIKPVEPLPKSEVAEVVEGDTSQGGHIHADGTWHEGPHETPGVSEVPTKVETSEAAAEVSDLSQPAMALTYHAELLVSHPVEALRQQGKERGHWSADHIPPFPPDDQEAAEFARSVYLWIYYQSTGQTDHPEYIRAVKAEIDFYDALQRSYDAGFGENVWEYARNLDLRKITWPLFDRFYFNPMRTTFTEADGINPESARPLLPFELEASGR